MLPRRKKNADRSRNGVVGSTGKNAPSTPSARVMQPSMVRMMLFKCGLFASSVTVNCSSLAGVFEDDSKDKSSKDQTDDDICEC